MKKQLFPLFLALLLIACGAEQPSPRADLIIHNAHVWTGESDSSFVQAIAIYDQRIMATGTDAEILALKGDSTRLINANGQLVTPGFNDAHIHFLSGSTILSNLDLLSTTSLAEMKERVLAYAKANPEKAWLTGRGWQYGFFSGGMPNKKYLDSLVPDRPVFIRAYDGHTGLANSKALAIAGINRNTVFTGFGEVVKDASGEPTGALLEGAQQLVSRVVPPATTEEKRNAIRSGLKYAASLGITSAQNANGDVEEYELYRSLMAEKAMTLRLAMGFSVDEETPEKDIQAFIQYKNTPEDTLWLKGRSIKFMLDGVIESHTAVMTYPYSDLPANHKDQQQHYAIPLAQYKALVARLDKEGFQLYTHAIGDGAVHEVLNAYQDAMVTNGQRERRHRIEHIEQVLAEDLPRFAQLGVLPSMQPIHADPGTVDVWANAVGPDRLPRSFAWRSMIRNGARLVYGADWPACISLDPMRGIHSAVNRRTINGEPPAGWVAEQRITVAEALRAYTVNAAFASFDESNKGMLRPGMLADLVILSQDLFRIDPMDIHKTRVDLTIVNGKTVYKR